MIDIEELKPLIVERLKSLNPDKIILFGSYAYGTPTEESDIDLFLLKDDLSVEDTRKYEIDAHLKMLDLIKKYHIGFDVLSAPTKYIQQREDYFYKIDILQNGKVIYEQHVS
jgi:uncharacterized protein